VVALSLLVSLVVATAALAALAPRALSANGALGASGRGGIVVSEDSLATLVGVEVLMAGGNAVDAALATALALAVTFPEAGNLGGGGFLLAYDAVDRTVWGLDFRETAPAAADPEMYLRLEAEGVADASTVGPLAGAIPGTPAGLFAAWRRGGTVSWRRLVEPARVLAAEGFRVGAHLHGELAEKASALGAFPSTRAVFFRGDSVVAEGDRLVQADLAGVLAAIAADGAVAFYRGPLARRMVAAVREAGGIWSADDLAAYEALPRHPIVIPLDTRTRLEVIALPPPSAGAVVLAETLALLRAQTALSLPASSPRRAAALVEAQRLAFEVRNTRLADPAFMGEPFERLLEPAYHRALAARLPARPPGRSRAVALEEVIESGNTTHIVAIDARGGVACLTTTVNGAFGGKWVIPGTGILLNNQMDDFDTRPGRPNLYDLVGSGLNGVQPGARPLSSMSPTLVMRAGEPWLALGARGGPRIHSAIAQVILRRVFDGTDLATAVAAPRIHHQWLPDAVFFEALAPDTTLRAALDEMGYDTETLDFIARVMAAERLPDGRFAGVVDPRTTGLALAVEPEEGLR
jgi:gamma-glutamyltranspeptidase/glutathione hydrolase